MKKVPSLKEQLKQGIEEVKLFKKGKLTFKTYKLNLPKEDFSPDDIKKIREEELNVSQSILANSLGVSVRTLQGWEIGKSKPIGPAARLLQLLREMPSVRKKLLRLA